MLCGGQAFTHKDQPWLMQVQPVASGGYSGTPDILWWKGNTGSGTTDTATVGPNLTLSSSAIWGTTFTPGGSSTDMVFNGTTHTASSASTVNYAGNSIITVEFRIFQTSYSTATIQEYLESSADWANFGDCWSIYNDTDGNSGAILINLNDHAGNNNIWSIARPSTSTWHHIAVVIDNATGAVTAYVDGSSVSVTTVIRLWTTAGALSSTRTLYFMARNNVSRFAPASTKDVRIFGGQRSAGNILTDATNYP